MTIKELYEWAVENGVEHLPVYLNGYEGPYKAELSRDVDITEDGTRIEM